MDVLLYKADCLILLENATAWLANFLVCKTDYSEITEYKLSLQNVVCFFKDSLGIYL